jgi:hypothetical protein
MLLYDTSVLSFNAIIIDTKETKMCLYTHENGALVLMASLKHPLGKVFFTTDDIYLHQFYQDKMPLQLLFESTSENIVTVVDGDEYKLYLSIDADIQLSEGEKMFSQFNKAIMMFHYN